MIRKLTILFLIILKYQFSFSQNFFDSTIKVDENNVPVDNKQFYFPKEMFPEIEIDFQTQDSINKPKTKVVEGKYDDFVMEWYSEHLFAMKEPLLFNNETNKEIYRFTWLRTFHKPVTIRIEKESSGYKIYWKVLSGAGGYEPGVLKVEKTKKITEKEWLKFIDLIEKSNFWKMDIGRNSMGNDGSEWILEGVNSIKYKVVTVWTPRSGDFYNACDYLISKTDLNIKSDEKY